MRKRVKRNIFIDRIYLKVQPIIHRLIEKNLYKTPDDFYKDLEYELRLNRKLSDYVSSYSKKTPRVNDIIIAFTIRLKNGYIVNANYTKNYLESLKNESE